MNTRASACLAPLIALLVMPVLAVAEAIDDPVSPPVLILLDDVSQFARPGQSYTNTLRVTLLREGSLGAFSFSDNAWTTVSLEQPPPGPLPEGTLLELDFEVTPVDPSQPLEVTTTYNGVWVGWAYDLSLRGWERANTARGIMSAALPGPDDGPVGEMQEPDEIEGSGPRRVITVHGRLVYWRDTSNYDSTPITIGAHGVTVRVWDDDSDGRDPMGETVTNANGEYSVPTNWTAGEDPDIYVEFRAENAHAAVGPVPTDDDETVYRWVTETKRNYEGTDCDFSTGWPADEDDWPVLGILTNLRRARDWMADRSVAPSAGVHVYYPGDKGYASYLDGYIRISESAAWAENTHVHEYGHHWMNVFNLYITVPDYCNEQCDPNYPEKCSHCDWCEENQYDSWNEGVADWFADVITRTFYEDYGRAALNGRAIDEIEECPESGGYWADPFIAEGYVHALLWDLMDNDPDDIADNETYYDDVLNDPSVDENDILSVLVSETPRKVETFIYDFFDSGAAPRYLIWETCANLGYWPLDREAPDAVSEITSTSHVIGEESADPTIDFEWPRPDDDFSGASGYAVAISAYPNHDPGHDYDLEFNPARTTINYTTDALPAGEHYISVRARDQVGRSSDAFTWSGPYDIRDPLPADIAYGQNLGGAVIGPLVLRDDDTATPGFIQWSETLPGDTGGVYWNLVTSNLGDLPVSEPFWNRLYVDGVRTQPAERVFVSSLPGGSSVVDVNRGPFTVPAGRHVISAYYDNQEAVPESIETNNCTAVQVCFIPPVMTEGTVYVRSAPPEEFGGFEHFHDDPPVATQNKDGLRFETGPGYDAVVVWATDNEDDYDCSLHAPAVAYDDGFIHAGEDPGYSTRPPGKVDAVITNAHASSRRSVWDVGVINASGGESDYMCTYVNSSPAFMGVTYSLSMAADERLLLRGFNLTSSELGWKEVTLDSDPGAGNLHLAWYAPTFEHGALRDYRKHDTTDAHGNARLEFQVNAEGYNLIAVWRDPIDDPETGLEAIDFQLALGSSRPDLVLLEEPEGWYSCVVPRPDTDGTPTIVYGPTSLPGDVGDTFLNINAFNQGMTDAGGVECEVQIDGVALASLSLGDCPAGANVTTNQTTAVQIPAGRHCLSVDADPYDLIAEVDEGNNRFAEQYVWQPQVLPVDGIVQRSVPPGPVSGWEAISELRGPIRYNCEGVGLPALGSTWYGAAIACGEGDDVDMRLHEALSGCKLGFGSPLAFSGWGAGESDFVLVNTAVATPRPFHIGLVGIAGGGTFDLDVARSTFLGNDPSGQYGPYTVGADELLDLHHVVLPAGAVEITLEDDGTDDLGLSIHRGDLPFGSKSQPIEDGISFMAPSGDTEMITTEIPVAGDYCIAVWRRSASTGGARAAVSYTIGFNQIVGVPPDDDEVQTGTALVSLFPTPFNRQLTIEFTLACDDDVEVEIYNVSGQRVRTLADGRLPAGPNVLVWDGTDDGGRKMPSGVYLVQLRGDSGTDRRKVALLR